MFHHDFLKSFLTPSLQLTRSVPFTTVLRNLKCVIDNRKVQYKSECDCSCILICLFDIMKP